MCDHALIGLSNLGPLYTLHINWCRLLHFTDGAHNGNWALTCVFVRERSRCVCVRLRVWQLFLRSSGKKREGYMQCCRIFNVRILFFRFWIEVRLLGGPQNHVPVVCVCERNHIISVSCFMSFLWNDISLCGNHVWGHLGNATGCPLWERFDWG